VGGAAKFEVFEQMTIKVRKLRDDVKGKKLFYKLPLSQKSIF
jgi:hypothetical protein